jgi:hypothetical protein
MNAEPMQRLIIKLTEWQFSDIMEKCIHHTIKY